MQAEPSGSATIQVSAAQGAWTFGAPRARTLLAPTRSYLSATAGVTTVVPSLRPCGGAPDAWTALTELRRDSQSRLLTYMKTRPVFTPTFECLVPFLHLQDGFVVVVVTRRPLVDTVARALRRSPSLMACICFRAATIQGCLSSFFAEMRRLQSFWKQW